METWYEAKFFLIFEMELLSLCRYVERVQYEAEPQST